MKDHDMRRTFSTGADPLNDLSDAQLIERALSHYQTLQQLCEAELSLPRPNLRILAMARDAMARLEQALCAQLPAGGAA